MTAITQKVLTAVDKSTRALSSANAALVKTVGELTDQVNVLTAQQIEVAQALEFGESELNELGKKTETAVREQAADLRLRVLENKDLVLAELMSDKGLATITKTDLAALQTALTGANQANAEAVENAVKAAVSNTENRYYAQINTMKSEHKVEIAQLNADASANQRTIDSLNEQIAHLRGDILAERTARVATEEARSRAAGVTVSTAK